MPMHDVREPGVFRLPTRELVNAGLAAYAELGRQMLEAIQSGLRWVSEHEKDIKQFLADAQTHGKGEWGYLLKLIDPPSGIAVMLALEMRRRWGGEAEDAIAEVMEEGLTDDGLVTEITAAIEAAGLPNPTQRQLRTGIDFLRAHDYELAVPVLISSLEGAFWRLAEQRGIIERNRKGKWICTARTDRPGKQIDGVEALFPLEGLGLEASFKQFLRGLAYGGSGHPYRHGTAESGWRLRALCLHASLIGWLDTAGHLDGRRSVRDAFARVHERHRAERALLEQSSG
jgi:hypothetical protein